MEARMGLSESLAVEEKICPAPGVEPEIEALPVWPLSIYANQEASRSQSEAESMDQSKHSDT